ncbi:hypothetical protein ACFE04_008920 [Oxalis oulophora]
MKYYNVVSIVRLRDVHTYNLYIYDEARNKKSICLQTVLSEDVRNEVLNQLNFESQQDGDWIEYKRINHSLPRHLRSKISADNLRSLANKVDLFKEISESTMNELSRRVEAYYFSPGDFIVKQDEASNCFYIVLEGKTELMNLDDTKQFVKLKSLTTCDELGVFFHEIQPYSVRVITNCHVLRVSVDDFRDCFPDLTSVGNNIASSSSGSKGNQIPTDSMAILSNEKGVLFGNSQLMKNKSAICENPKDGTESSKDSMEIEGIKELTRILYTKG